MISELNERSRDIFRHIVDAYVETGEPVGSRTLSRRLGLQLSPATIRTVMQDLEEAGLLFSPHVSAGRIPTDIGLRLFVDGLLEIGSLTKEEQESIDLRCRSAGKNIAQLLEEASETVSGLSHCAGLVVAPKTESTLRHIEFVNLGPGRALVVTVTEDGLVENRILEVPVGLPPSSLTIASNYLSAKLVGRTIDEAHRMIALEADEQRQELDVLTSRVVDAGLAVWAGDPSAIDQRALIVRGQANLLGDVHGLDDLERIRVLFQALDAKSTMVQLLEAARSAEGVQIFIGAESELFSLAGCSMVVAPYNNSRNQIIGAIGVIGPTRINYARIIPIVDYTAKVVSKLLG